MKSFYLSLVCLLLVVWNASAAILSFPYEECDSEIKSQYGYKIERQESASVTPFWRLTIPPKSAKLFRLALIEILDLQGKTLAEMDFSATHCSDGSLVFTLHLQDSTKARLIIQTDVPEEFGLNFNPGGGFGGFSFDVPPPITR